MALETPAKARYSTSNITYSKTHCFHRLLSDETNWILAFAREAVFLFSKKEF